MSQTNKFVNISVNHMKQQIFYDVINDMWRVSDISEMNRLGSFSDPVVKIELKIWDIFQWNNELMNIYMIRLISDTCKF